MIGSTPRCRAAAHRLRTAALVMVTLGLGACGGAPCEAMVDKQISLVKASGSAAEKATVEAVEATENGREGLIEVCTQQAKSSGTYAQQVSCQAKAGDLGAFKACVGGAR